MADWKCVPVGERVRVARLGDTTGFFIQDKHLDARKEGVKGVVTGWVPGHGGDVWWVQHDGDGSVVGAYMYDELEPEDPTP